MNLELPPRPKSNRLITALIIVLVFTGGLFLGRYIVPINTQNLPQTLSFVSIEEGKRQLIFPTFWEAWDVLHNNFIGDLDEKQLFYGAVAGMVKAAGDPFTAFADPDQTKQLEETLNGSFSGVGIEIGPRNQRVTVIAPLPESPADLAGIKTGDVITAIDHEPITPDSTLTEVVQKIRGPKGSEVILTVVHENEQSTVDIPVIRDTIEVDSVKMDITDQIAHVEIISFNADTGQDFSATAREALRQGVKGVILDMRNNPGGFLQAAVDVSSELLPKDTLVVTERGKDDSAREHKTSGRPTLGEIPIVVLVNGGSASASEIVAGALQDQRDVKIIGQQTFGKGSVQDWKKLADGSSVRVTIAKWFTPGGRSIADEGIEPNITVTNDPNRDPDDDSTDQQLQAAREQLFL